ACSARLAFSSFLIRPATVSLWACSSLYLVSRWLFSAACCQSSFNVSSSMAQLLSPAKHAGFSVQQPIFPVQGQHLAADHPVGEILAVGGGFFSSCRLQPFHLLFFVPVLPLQVGQHGFKRFQPVHWSPPFPIVSCVHSNILVPEKKEPISSLQPMDCQTGRLLSCGAPRPAKNKSKFHVSF